MTIYLSPFVLSIIIGIIGATAFWYGFALWARKKEEKDAYG